MQRKFRHATHLSSFVNAARIFPEGGFLSVAQQTRAGDVMMMAYLSAAQPGIVDFSLIDAGFAVRICRLVIDAADLVFGGQRIPSRRFIGIKA